jgi:hypothetical protein
VCWVFGTHHEVEERVERSNRQCCSQTTQPEQHQSRPERDTRTEIHTEREERERERRGGRGFFTVADNEKGDDDELFDRDGCIRRSQMSTAAARTIGVQAVLGQKLKKRLL